MTTLLTWPREVLVVGTRAEELTRGSHREFLLAGLTLTPAASAAEALVLIGDGRDVAAVLVGDTLPDIGVADFGTILRTLTRVPVIYGMTRAHSEAPCERIDELTGFAWLPASPGRLRQTVQALVRAAAPRERRVKEVGELVVDLDAAAVRWHGSTIRFGDQSLRILDHLVDAYPRIVPVEELDRATEFGAESRSGSTRVRVAVSRIREQFVEAAPAFPPPVVTVRGHGYGIGASALGRSTLAIS